ncbi:MAG TPA: hypothetical protein VE863_07925 [Pyrinomonadaceae bacterium]|jgi:hypothetical protein|nr:hypothetical protein [Pyrinomonadaceae bacterium]
MDRNRLLLALLILACVTSSFSVLGQEKKPTSDDKDRLKNQPELLINADIEKVRSVIIQGMLESKYTLDKEAEHQLVFRKEIKGGTGFAAGLLLGSDQQNPHQIITFIMTKQDAGVLVAERVAILYPDRKGQGMPRDVDSKKIRRELWANLDEIKEKSEKK